MGPRQCGKTTFAKTELSGWRILDMERPSDLAKLESDPEDFLERAQGKIVFDEAQRFPQIFPILRSIVDAQRKNFGRFVLLGSVSPHLVRGVPESLAGRVGFLDMTPFIMGEVSSWRNLWFRGGFPQAHLEGDDSRRNEWFEAYTRTFIERDLQQLGIRVSSAQMRKLWSMLAHVHGGIWNASEIGNSLGVNYHTVNRYVEILEESFLMRRLSPYFVNIGKRLVKSPKIYLRDTGLLHHFLGISSAEILAEHPKRGASWEGFVVEQAISFVSLQHPEAQYFFWKTATGQEVDLLIKVGKTILPIEIKTQGSPRKSDVKGLVACLEDLRLREGYVVRPQGETYSLGDGIRVVTLEELLKKLGKFF